MTTDLQPLVASELRRLSDALAVLDAEQWMAPSLCAGWTIAHVVAHLTMPARYAPEPFHAELAAAGYDFTTLSNRIAARDADLPSDRLLTDLRSEVLALWATPDGGYLGALSHVVIHGLDVTVPLGLGRVSTDDAVRAVLDHLTTGGAHRHFGTTIAGRALCADDLDRTWGDGEEVHGLAHVLVLALAGREVDDLDLRTPMGRRAQ